MISDKLFELAFEYKKTKLWNKVWDNEVYAVRLSDGSIGYCSVMGALGEHCALGLYIGEEGYNSYRNMVSADAVLMTLFRYHELVMTQECLQCVFDSKDVLSNEEVEETRDYSRRHGISLRGSKAYPQFIKYQKNRVPWRIEQIPDQKFLCEALSAAIALADFLHGRRKKEIGLDCVTQDTETVPLAEWKEGHYVWSRIELPPEPSVEYPRPEPVNDIALARMKKIKRVGVWQAELVRLPTPIQDQEGEVPVFPVVLMSVMEKTEYLLPMTPALFYEEEPETLLNNYIEACISHNVCPLSIKVEDERTYAMLERLCDKLNIPLKIAEDLSELYVAEDIFMEDLESGGDELDDMEQILDVLMDADDEEIDSIPDYIFSSFQELADVDVLPEELSDKLCQFLDRESEDGQKTKKASGKKIARKKTEKKVEQLVIPKQSYVISVSYGTGCYRHIQISANNTLFDLHEAILDAFGFDDDHAHAFFMDNKSWSERDSYYVPGIESESRTTVKYRLGQVGLEPGKKFKYVFDFGDEWTFQCKVLRAVEKETEMPVVIRSQGEPPKQYGDWDDEF